MTVKACVIGWPIGHSRSPLIHGHWLAKYGIDGSYTQEEVHPDALEEFLTNIPANGFSGCNVTVPHKESALKLADIADETAEAIGAANTLWHENGALYASNTDVYGFMTHLDMSAPDWGAGRPVMVLGAGGAARAVVKGLADRGLPEIRIANRTVARAQTLADHFGDPALVAEWGHRSEALEGCGLLVNTTTLGMTGSAPLEIDLDALPEDAVVMDIVYSPLTTDLLARAMRRGNRVVDGLGMLLHQAVPGFERWFGVRPEVTPELRALVVADLGGA